MADRERFKNDGVLTLNSRSGGTSFTGAIAAAGLAGRAWSEAHFRRHMAACSPAPIRRRKNPGTGGPRPCGHRRGRGAARFARRGRGMPG